MYDFSLASFGHKTERMIDWFLYEDAVTLFRKGLHGKEYAAHNPRNIANHLSCDIHSMLFLVPTANAFVVRRILASIA